MLYRYLTILIACASLLVGIQIPNFADQYEKRLEAHLAEAAAGLRGYQQIADRSFGGSIEALIQKHTASDDPVFRAEAQPIGTIYRRYQRFKAEKAALDTNLPERLYAIARQRDRELLGETYARYSFAVPLDADAVYAGFALVAAVLLLFELLALVLRALFGAKLRVAGPRMRVTTIRG